MDFLLELLSEEIPARMQEKASADLARLFAEELAKSGIAPARLESYATPRRLALIARGLPMQTAAVSEEIKGPRTSAPPQALEGFLRKTGLAREDLVERDGILFAVLGRPGRATADVLAEAVPAIVRAFPWPKSMRWGAGNLRWVRPLQGIVALLGDELVPFEIDGVPSRTDTVGHRFHHPGPITIGNADDYAAKLRACHVIVDRQERMAMIREGAAKAAAAAGLSVVPDEGLVAENAGLTEWPVPLLGHFDPAFLEVPREVIQLTMRTNQKYFACVDADGRLAPNFICTANVTASDGGASIVAGNQKVLAARLSDAKFFWEHDLKIPLEDQARKLDQIVFHEKLGTVADKVDRVAKLARWLVEEGIITPLPAGEREGPAPQAREGEGTSPPASAPLSPVPSPSHRSAAGPSDRAAGSSPGRTSEPPDPPAGRGELATLAEQAARLAKADLVTGMVGEFPELQGVMGGYYARAQGLPDAVADAIRDHYKPVGQGDEVPTAPVTVAVSLADKLDTLVGFFGIKEAPTGSKDPYALRRAALSIIRVLEPGWKVPLTKAARSSADFWTFSLMSAARRNNPRFDKFMASVSNADYSENHLDQIKRRRADFIRDTGVDPLVGLRSADTERFSRAITDFAANERLEYDLLDFFADRLKVQQREAGVRHDLIDAVFALGGEDDLVRLLARVKALQSFVATEDGANLLVGYRRAANIVRIEAKKDSDGTPLPGKGGAGGGSAGMARDSDAPTPGPSLRAGRGEATGFPTAAALGYTPLPEEAALLAALDAAEPRAAAAVEAEDFEGAMAALASLRAPIDAFFDKVTVNDPDGTRRAARLAMLARIRDAVHTVADFSKIEG